MIDMDLLSVIRRWHFRQGIPIREIRRRTGLSRNTIRKYLRDDAVEPTFKVPKRPSKLDQFAEKLTTWLRVESGKSRKQKRTAKQLHADLVMLGYEGSYGRVAAFARAWKAERQYEKQTSGRGTFVPLIFQPGEAFQFDWSEDYALLNGRPIKLQVAHTKLSHSRAFITRAYLLQTHEMLFDALTHAFRVLGGVPQRGIFDNMKTAVDRIGQVKSDRSMRGSLPWPVTTCSRRIFAIRPQAGRKARSRKTFRMRVDGYGSQCPASRILMPSMPGWKSGASHSGEKSSMASCRHSCRCACR